VVIAVRVGIATPERCRNRCNSLAALECTESGQENWGYRKLAWRRLAICRNAMGNPAELR
jgi:hypothetical protein